MRGDRKACYNRIRFLYNYCPLIAHHQRILKQSPSITPQVCGVLISLRSLPGVRSLMLASPGLMFCRPLRGLWVRLPSSAPPTPRQAPSLAGNYQFAEGATSRWKECLIFRDSQVTNYDGQVVEHGDCVAYSVAWSTVHAPGFASRCARLLPASLRYAETGRRSRPRLKARAAAEA